MVEALWDIESQKELWGLDGVEFKDLCLGKPGQTYDYVENRLVPGREWGMACPIRCILGKFIPA